MGLDGGNGYIVKNDYDGEYYAMYIFNTIKKPQPFKVFQRDGTLEVVVPFLKLSNTDFIKKHKIITLKFIID